MKPALILVALLASAGAASAHVTVQPASAPAGAYQVLRFGVGHGCGGKATTSLRIDIPAGVATANPQPKPGWTLTIDHANAAEPRATAITWRGELPADQFDEFLIHAKLPATPSALAFPATQVCGGESVAWTEPSPASGERPAHPAPLLMLTGSAGSAASPPVPAAAPTAARSGPLPAGVQLKDGVLYSTAGLPLYTFNFDTMVGMSHCEGDCATMWPPLRAPANAKAAGDWSLIPRSDGAKQWAYKTKPLYTYSGDKPGAAPAGEQFPQWRLAR